LKKCFWLFEKAIIFMYEGKNDLTGGTGTLVLNRKSKSRLDGGI